MQQVYNVADIFTRYGPPWRVEGSTADGKRFPFGAVASWPVNPPLIGFYTMSIGPDPNILMNPHNHQVIHTNLLRWSPGEISFHPGPHGQRSHIIFTCPKAGPCEINASFYGVDQKPTSSDVIVTHNGAVIFGPVYINNAYQPHNFLSTIQVQAGSVIEFSVGWGNNGNCAHDTTGLRISIRN